MWTKGTSDRGASSRAPREGREGPINKGQDLIRPSPQNMQMARERVGRRPPQAAGQTHGNPRRGLHLYRKGQLPTLNPSACRMVMRTSTLCCWELGMTVAHRLVVSHENTGFSLSDPTTTLLVWTLIS